MFYLGIDIGKRNHEVGLINDSGDPVGNTLRFKNTKAGSDQLLKFINRHQLTPDDVAVGMEATGHYWLSVFSFLKHLDFKITVFNPMQSDALRHFYIRKTKTDIKDAYLIAQVIRMDTPEETPFLEEDLMRIKQLERFRYGIVDQTSGLKRKVITVLDQVFPEYDGIFSDTFGQSSKQLLLEYTLPEDILTVETDTLAEMLNQVSQKRLGQLRANQKAEQVKQLATDSFGIALGTDVFKLEIQLMIEQIQLLESQLKMVEDNMIALSQKQKHYLTTITGVSDVTAAVILGEVGDFDRFERPEQLVAFAGLDASVHQSGDFTSTRTRISKRGSPYLRRAIWQAAFVASNRDPVLSAYYKKLRTRGKAHGTAVGAVARKLTHIIFAIMRDQKPYKPHSPSDE